MNDIFWYDVEQTRIDLLHQANKIENFINKFSRNNEDEIAYYAYLKNFSMNGGALCSEIILAASNKSTLLALIGARSMLEDFINVSYLKSISNITEREKIANDWFYISCNPKARKEKINGIGIENRAKLAGEDMLSFYKEEYGELCNYSHNTAQRYGLANKEASSLLSQKVSIMTLQFYSYSLKILEELVGINVEDEKDQIYQIIRKITKKYHERVIKASLPELSKM